MNIHRLTNVCKSCIITTVCVVQMRAVKNVSCPCPKTAGNHHRGTSLTAFLLPQTVLRTSEVGLHGLLGVEHRLSYTPTQAERPVNEGSQNTHRTSVGQAVHGVNRWLKAALGRAIIAPSWARMEPSFHPWGTYVFLQA